MIVIMTASTLCDALQDEHEITCNETCEAEICLATCYYTCYPTCAFTCNTCVPTCGNNQTCWGVHTCQGNEFSCHPPCGGGVVSDGCPTYQDPDCQTYGDDCRTGWGATCEGHPSCQGYLCPSENNCRH